jgi:hypothetical protein
LFEVVVNASIREALEEFFDAYPEIIGDQNNFIFFNTKVNCFMLPIGRGQAWKIISTICQSEYYSSDQFHYDVENERYICPQNQFLPLWSRRKSEENYVYRADAKVCDACPVKGECTGSNSGRHIFRSFHQEYTDKVKAFYKSEAYKKASRKRSV